MPPLFICQNIPLSPISTDLSRTSFSCSYPKYELFLRLFFCLSPSGFLCSQMYIAYGYSDVNLFKPSRLESAYALHIMQGLRITLKWLFGFSTRTTFHYFSLFFVISTKPVFNIKQPIHYPHQLCSLTTSAHATLTVCSLKTRNVDSMKIKKNNFVFFSVFSVIFKCLKRDTHSKHSQQRDSSNLYENKIQLNVLFVSFRKLLKNSSFL